MKPFRQIHANQIDSADLVAEMTAHGYVMIRGLLSPRDLTPLIEAIAGILQYAGWLEPDSDPLDRVARSNAACCDDDAKYRAIYDQVFALQAFHALPHHAAMQRAMTRFVGPKLLIHPKSVARIVFPNFEAGVTRAHQDHTAVGGDAESFTAWMPLHDCPVEQGALRVLAGSHRFGLQPTAGDTGYISPGMERGGEWVGGDIHAGDLLIFHSLTVHEAAPNRSSRLRISLDCRFQSYLNHVNPGTLVFAGSGRRSWENTYRNWPSDELKYYWTRLPLQLKPSTLELAQLVQNAETSELRLRYARILQRIEEQMSPAAV